MIFRTLTDLLVACDEYKGLLLAGSPAPSNLQVRTPCSGVRQLRRNVVTMW